MVPYRWNPKRSLMILLWMASSCTAATLGSIPNWRSRRRNSASRQQSGNGANGEVRWRECLGWECEEAKPGQYQFPSGIFTDSAPLASSLPRTAHSTLLPNLIVILSHTSADYCTKHGNTNPWLSAMLGDISNVFRWSSSQTKYLLSFHLDKCFITSQKSVCLCLSMQF